MHEFELELLEVLSQSARGSRRDGAFAVWLAVRVAVDLAGEDGPAERGHRRRVQALEHRLSSLNLPPPLRRALQGTLAELREARPENGVLALAQLVAPVRESVGPDAAETVRVAAREARQRVQRRSGD